MKHLYCLFFLLFSSVTLADREILVPDGPPKFCHLPTVEGETNECGTTTIKREIIGEGVSGFSAGYEIEQNLKRITVSDDYKLKKGEYETEDSKKKVINVYSVDQIND
ncbi:hypothetical protein AB832_08270 [Flavobacteriaceae bacterium (ex Bugula neritina AB1)]|nr:hypothetical protein AB832_08270 [Flavobacteriaceae bacterium (ex Bugula neritina AB1)]